MKLQKRIYVFIASLLALGGTAMQASAAQGPVPVGNGIMVGASYQNDISLPLYYLPARPNLDNGERNDGPENPQLPNNHIDSPDPVIQHTMAPSPEMPVPILNFNGIPFPGVNCNCAPPDTNGEVGETQFVQMVNDGFQVFDKATGNSLLGPQSITSLWAGFGGVCETHGDGDPVVLYDQLANRWLISEFAGNSVPTDECIAISTTSDATGTWSRYGFHLGTNFFDYPHIGVWPDGYYMAMNIFNSSGTAFLGPQAFAFDRTAMLAGQPATFVTPGITGGPSENAFLPADLDGSIQPPLGAPNPFVEFPGSGVYKVRQFHADFAVPANTTFTLFASPPAAGFTSLCPGNRACVPQLGGTGGNAIDGIGDRLMFRLTYRNFGDHEAAVGNYSVNAGGVAGVRWFELRNVIAGPVTVFQESTYQPDTTWRWMGSAAMDSAGDLAVGFSASSASIHPSVRYAGRLSTDPLNSLAQGETDMFDGAGSQTGTSNRWGDYSALTVDPVDDCTFWYTNEYYQTTSQFNWRTRIGNFKFDQCGTPGFTLNPSPQSQSVCAGTPATFDVDVGSVSAFDSPVTLSASGNPSPSTATFAPNPVPSLPGVSTLTIDNTSGVADGTYPIQISGTATGAADKTANVSLTVAAAAPGAPSLTSPANGSTQQPLRPVFTWTGTADSYVIDVATDSGFSNIVFTATVAATTATPNADLQSNTQFFWRVTGSNICGDGAASSTFSFTTVPILHTVTPLNGANGSIVPSTPQSVIDGETTAFTVTPDNGFVISSVTGCGGSLSGNTYTTGPITADCTVITAFAPVPDVALTINDNRTFAQYGNTLIYSIVISNSTTAPASPISVSNAFPPELDISTATWTCAGGSGATCTASGTGALSDSGVVVPAHGNVTYTLTATVLANSASSQVDNQVSVTGPGGSHSADDVDTLVIFRAGFELGDNGGNVTPTVPAGPAPKTKSK